MLGAANFVINPLSTQMHSYVYLDKCRAFYRCNLQYLVQPDLLDIAVRSLLERNS